MSQMIQSSVLYQKCLKNHVKFTKSLLKGSKNKCPAKCLKCGFNRLPDGTPWSPIPYYVTLGHGCPKCANILKYTTDSYSKKLKLTFPKRTSIVTGEYVNLNSPLKHFCVLHNYHWKSTPKSILFQGTQCPKCSGSVTKLTKSDYRKRLKGTSVNLIGELLGTRKRTLHQCRTCKHQWPTSPNSILKGSRCPKCSRKQGTLKRITPKPKYLEKLKNGKFNVTLIGTYTNSTVKTLHQCNKCSHTWNVTPSTILTGRGCPKCKDSKLERRTSLILNKLKIKFERQKSFKSCKFKKPLRFDFHLTNHNIAIECQGEQHYRPWAFSKKISNSQSLKQFSLIKKRDEIKVKFCKKHKIKLLLVKYNLNETNIEKHIKKSIQ